MLVRDPDRGRNMVKTTTDPGAPLLKKMKTHSNPTVQEAGTSSALGDKNFSSQGKQCAPLQESPDDENSEGFYDNSLLLDTLA